MRLSVRSTQRLPSQLRLALEPECFENPTATAREIPRDGADSVRNTQAVCGFRCWASKFTPLFHTIKAMVAIFLAKVRRAISGRMPLVSKAVWRTLAKRTGVLLEGPRSPPRTLKQILQIIDCSYSSSPRMELGFFTRSSCPLTSR